MHITANATRDGNWWMILVPEVDGGMTQCRRVDQVADAARSVVSDLLGVDPTTITVTENIELQEEDREAINLAKESLAAADAAVKAAASRNFEAVSWLRGKGYTTREVAKLMGLTPGRINQIEHKTAA